MCELYKRAGTEKAAGCARYSGAQVLLCGTNSTTVLQESLLKQIKAVIGWQTTVMPQVATLTLLLMWQSRPMPCYLQPQHTCDQLS